MDKKIFFSIFAITLVALLGVGFVAANNVNKFIPKMNFNQKSKLNQTEIDQIRNFSTQLENSIKNNDYASWKSLMESQLSQENFNKIVARYNESKARFNNSSHGEMPFDAPGFSEHFPNSNSSMKSNFSEGNFSRGMKGRMHKFDD